MSETLFVALIGVVGTLFTGLAAFALGLAKMATDKSLAVAREQGAQANAVLLRDKDLEIARLEVPQTLAIAYDTDLRAQRLRHYTRLWRRTHRLAKYPRLRPMTAAEAAALSATLGRWYFSGGGLFFTEGTRDAFFDLQDGLKLVIERRDVEAAVDTEALRGWLDRPAGWTPPPALLDIARAPIGDPAAPLPDDVVEGLRRLASRLRTAMTEDVLTRAPSALGSSDAAATS
ncbi:MAG: hypothetical protein AAFX81_01320 [Pseudomonadota bacterium]